MSRFGLLNVHKPAGVTSRKVVDRVQRLVRPEKVGHAGTLDPLASGVLLLGIGQATRLVEYLHELPKSYRATFLLGRASDTEDIEGQVTEFADAPRPSMEDLRRAAATFTGAIEQRPPAFSALKVAGRRAYDLARAGKTVELAPRTVHIHRLTIERYDYPELQLEVACSSGTYIRSLGRDLAERAATSAVMSALVRMSIGPFTLAEAVDLEAIEPENLPRQLLPPTHAVQAIMPLREVTADEAARLANGRAIEMVTTGETRLAAVDAHGRLVAILALRDAAWWPEKFFPVELR